MHGGNSGTWESHYVSSSFTNQVLRYNGTTGAFIDDFVPQASGDLFAPAGLVFGPDGNLYVSSSSNSGVLRYNGTTGAFIDVFVPFGSGG
jgi:DNA-binding beta-propeller fold protein YncE